MGRSIFRLLTVAIVLTVRGPACLGDTPKPADETWDALYLGTDKIGYNHTVVRKIEENGRDLLQVAVETVTSMKRFGTTIELRMNYQSIETPEGNLLRIDNRTKLSAVEQRTHGELKGNKMLLTLETPGKQITQEIPWDDEVLGQNAQDMVLRKHPVKPGESHDFRAFMPDLNQVVRTTLEGETPEEINLMDGTQRTLQRVRVRLDLPGFTNLKSFAWVDPSGETLKTYTDMLGGMATYRVTKEMALAKAGPISKDFGRSTLIKSDKTIPRPYDTTEVVYRIELKGEDAGDVFPRDDRQSLAKDEHGAWRLTIRSLEPKADADRAPAHAGNEFLRANNYLQIDDPKVIAEAKEAVGDATDTWDKARRIEKWVFEHMTEKNFTVGFATAAEVARNLEGDCTEHGVLLAALARVAGIPSRVAMGLVYANMKDQAIFGYHMWAEVNIDGQWIPLDGTLGRGHASPTHIKLGDSSLEGVDAMVTFLPVARVLDRLKIEIVSYKHADDK